MIKSIAYYKIVETMNDYKIPILIDPKRTGKSTILKQIKEENQSTEILSIDILGFKVLRSYFNTYKCWKKLNNLTSICLKNLSFNWVKKSKF